MFFNKKAVKPWDSGIDKAAKALMAVAFIAVLVIWGVMGVVIYKVGSQDYSQGIKPVISKVWCGSTDCLK